MVFILKKHILHSLSATFQKAVFLPVLYWTLASLGLILSVWRTGDIHLNSKLNFKDSQEVFDFVIVGAGSAGSVVANRLSKYYNVLLLEAGGEPHPLQSIPGFAIFLQNWDELDYRWRTVPQKHATLISVNQQSSWSAGRGLGGTGNLNTMLYLKGNPKDYDNYAEISGDPSWGYEGVTPFFNDLETYADPNGHKRYHGFHGEMSVELPEHQGLAGHWLKAGQEFGYPEIDVNAPHTEGFFRNYHTTKNGIRHSSYRAFLQPIRLRHSLTIRKYAHVNKIIFDEHDHGKVIGVEYDRNGIKRRAIARKEVIISAGTIISPKILMLSGIGPSKHLEKLSIPVKHDLPVGRHLQDHISVFLGPFFVKQPTTIYLDRDVTPGAFVNWFSTGTDVLATSGALASAVFTSSFAKARGEFGWPDIQLVLYGYSVWSTFPETFSRAFGLKLDEMKRYYTHAIGKESFHVAVSGARPYARGYIELASTSPYDSPIIDPNYLSDKGDIDIKVLVEGIKAVLQLAENTTTFQEVGAHFTDKRLPGCEHLPFRSDEYWFCYARRYSVTLHHPVGTASMGRRGSPHAVVDSELKVIGVSNLRVIDASILPVVPTTNTQAASMMVGNKGANMILQHWLEIDSKIAAEQNLLKEQEHSQLLNYVFEPLNNDIPQSHGPGHSINIDLTIPKLNLDSLKNIKVPKLNLDPLKNIKVPKLKLDLKVPKVNLDLKVPKLNFDLNTPKLPRLHLPSPLSLSPVRLLLKTKKTVTHFDNPISYPPNHLKCIDEDFECWEAKFPPSFPNIHL